MNWLKVAAREFDFLDFEESTRLGRWQDHRSIECGEGKIGTPKSGKEREIPLSNDAVAALKSYRHLKGPLVSARARAGC
jgi:integrase